MLFDLSVRTRDRVFGLYQHIGLYSNFNYKKVLLIQQFFFQKCYLLKYYNNELKN